MTCGLLRRRSINVEQTKLYNRNSKIKNRRIDDVLRRTNELLLRCWPLTVEKYEKLKSKTNTKTFTFLRPVIRIYLGIMTATTVWSQISNEIQ